MSHAAQILFYRASVSTLQNSITTVVPQQVRQKIILKIKNIEINKHYEDRKTKTSRSRREAHR